MCTCIDEKLALKHNIYSRCHNKQKVSQRPSRQMTFYFNLSEMSFAARAYGHGYVRRRSYFRCNLPQEVDGPEAVSPNFEWYVRTASRRAPDEPAIGLGLRISAGGIARAISP